MSTVDVEMALLFALFLSFPAQAYAAPRMRVLDPATSEGFGERSGDVVLLQCPSDNPEKFKEFGKLWGGAEILDQVKSCVPDFGDKETRPMAPSNICPAVIGMWGCLRGLSCTYERNCVSGLDCPFTKACSYAPCLRKSKEMRCKISPSPEPSVKDAFDELELLVRIGDKIKEAYGTLFANIMVNSTTVNTTMIFQSVKEGSTVFESLGQPRGRNIMTKFRLNYPFGDAKEIPFEHITGFSLDYKPFFNGMNPVNNIQDHCDGFEIQGKSTHSSQPAFPAACNVRLRARHTASGLYMQYAPAVQPEMTAGSCNTNLKSVINMPLAPEIWEARIGDRKPDPEQELCWRNWTNPILCRTIRRY
ncbi:hypothetical protein RJ55_06983 [Drechmeria coniospora]|nr:hypothetical protein RJ55_06983 [Drechmeria coniospora]